MEGLVEKSLAFVDAVLSLENRREKKTKSSIRDGFNNFPLRFHDHEPFDRAVNQCSKKNSAQPPDSGTAIACLR